MTSAYDRSQFSQSAVLSITTDIVQLQITAWPNQAMMTVAGYIYVR